MLISAVDESLGIVDSKAVLNYFAEQIPKLDRAVVKEICSIALSRIQNRIVSFEEQV